VVCRKSSKGVSQFMQNGIPHTFLGIQLDILKAERYLEFPIIATAAAASASVKFK
jgi:hypothetical protein